MLSQAYQSGPHVSQIWHQVAGVHKSTTILNQSGPHVSQVWHQVATVSADSERSDLDEPQPDSAAGEPGVCHRPVPTAPCVTLPPDGFPPHGPHCQRRQQVCTSLVSLRQHKLHQPASQHKLTLNFVQILTRAWADDSIDLCADMPSCDLEACSQGTALQLRLHDLHACRA